MDFTLSKEHEMARKLFHDFAENEVKPLAQEDRALPGGNR
jgi:butyryl-CoA dehydrogenase